ncbi:MAG: hypothetical protein HQL56_00305 [Magnetococcales bacterium]|nr:hypothetical protein [Magnetococcales bacterium]
MNKSFQDHLLLELDGKSYLVGRRKAIPVEDLSLIHGDKWFVTDFQGCPPRTMVVDAPVRYAEVVLRRKLQDIGEAGASANVLTQWKRSRGRGTTDIAYTVVEQERFGPYLDRVYTDASHHLVFSTNAILYGILRRLGRTENLAVLFEHDRHVDLMVGRSGKVYGANRLSSYSTDEEARATLSHSAADEIRGIMSRNKIKVDRLVYFNWWPFKEKKESTTTSVSLSGFGDTDSAKDNTQSGWADTSKSQDVEEAALLAPAWVVNLSETVGIPHQFLKGQRLDVEEGEAVMTSLPSAMRYLEDSDSVSGWMNIASYRTQHMILPILAVAWVLVTILFFGQAWLNNEADAMTAEYDKSAREIAVLESVKAVGKEELDVVAFSKRLSEIREIPPIGRILSDLTSAREGRMFLDKVEVSFANMTMPTVEVVGRVVGGFDETSMHHGKFLANLRGMKYEVEKSNFGTNIQELSFQLTLKRSPS